MLIMPFQCTAERLGCQERAVTLPNMLPIPIASALMMKEAVWVAGRGAPQKPAARKAAPKPAARRYLEEAEVEEITYRVGDSAYIIMEPGEYGSEEEYEPCEVCERAKKTAGRREIPLLECDRCLRGYHLTCLEPPLPHVPEASKQENPRPFNCFHYRWS